MKKIISIITVMIFLLSALNINGMTNIMTPEQAANIVINDVLKSSRDDLLIYVWGPVSAGVDVKGTEEFLFKTSEDGYVVYIDLYPTANLFHPVQYIFVYQSNGEYFIKDANSPPENFNDYKNIPTAIGNILNSAENRRPTITDKNYETSTTNRQNKWAVLMNGGYNQYNNHVRYWNDLSNIYITLVTEYNYADENIIVLCSDGLNPAPDQSNGLNSNPDLDGDGDDDIMYSCVLSNVNLVFEDLANDLNAGDKLFIFTTDHGNTNGGWDTYFNLWNMEELTDAHFASLLDALPDCEIICTFEPCFSGGFLDNVVVPPGPVVASSACRHDEYSYAMGPDYVYDEYVFYWTAAVKGEDAYGNPVNADYNSDGVITMDEAFIYAESHDTAPESPQYDDYPEDIGTTISLAISNFAPEIPQKPEGPTDGIIKKEYTYETTTSDEEGDDIYYMWDWGDDSFSEWFGPYESYEIAQASHEWELEGTYEISVKAKDSIGSESDWSDPLTIYILNAPYLEIGNITGGLRIKAEISNTGIDALGVDTRILVEGKNVFLGHEKINKLSIIRNDEKVVIFSDLILGIGNIQITIEASIDESFASKTVNGFVFLFLVIISNDNIT